MTCRFISFSEIRDGAHWRFYNGVSRRGGARRYSRFTTTHIAISVVVTSYSIIFINHMK